MTYSVVDAHTPCFGDEFELKAHIGDHGKWGSIIQDFESRCTSFDEILHADKGKAVLKALVLELGLAAEVVLHNWLNTAGATQVPIAAAQLERAPRQGRAALKACHQALVGHGRTETDEWGQGAEERKRSQEVTAPEGPPWIYLMYLTLALATRWGATCVGGSVGGGGVHRAATSSTRRSGAAFVRHFGSVVAEDTEAACVFGASAILEAAGLVFAAFECIRFTHQGVRQKRKTNNKQKSNTLALIMQLLETSRPYFCADWPLAAHGQLAVYVLRYRWVSLRGVARTSGAGRATDADGPPSGLGPSLSPRHMGGRELGEREPRLAVHLVL
ncbi:hypothetical protein C8R44DRAFT_739371 [Mycena epipterygia]|nr:hypothetical protein C8R44DRAFT_739371 [Mycena epipterygia]